MKNTIAIVGSSISGSTLAYLLAKQGKKVVVYEKSDEKNLGNKACANVVTKTFLDYCKELGINSSSLIKNKFEKAVFFSGGKKFNFSVEDYEIDREKFLRIMIKKAKQQGARFHFNMKFIDMKQGKSYDLIFENGNKQVKEHANFVIGADGALSEVARKAGLFNNRKFFLYIQTKLKDKIKVNGSLLNKNEYCVFSEKGKGYYSYVLPSARHTVLGVGDFLENNPIKTFENVCSFAGNDSKTKKTSKEAALVPLPSNIKTRKDNVFLAGDAACSTKFNGGGIIPAMKDAFAIADVITKNDYTKMKQREHEKRMNSYFVKIFRRMNNKGMTKFFEIIHHVAKVRNVVKERDEASFF